MNMPTTNIVRAAVEAVERLLAECRKGGTLYLRHPPAVAQVNRTGRQCQSCGLLF